MPNVFGSNQSLSQPDPKRLQEELVMCRKELETVRQVQKEEKKTLEAAMANRDNLMQKLKTTEQALDTKTKQFDKDLAKLKNEHNLELTKMKMDRSAQTTKAQLDVKKVKQDLEAKLKEAMRLLEERKEQESEAIRRLESEEGESKELIVKLKHMVEDAKRETQQTINDFEKERADLMASQESLREEIRASQQNLASTAGGSNAKNQTVDKQVKALQEKHERELKAIHNDQKVFMKEKNQEIESLVSEYESKIQDLNDEIASLRQRFENDYNELETQVNRLKGNDEMDLASQENLPQNEQEEEEQVIVQNHIRAIYESFCSFGSDRNLATATGSIYDISDPHIDGPKFHKFAKDCKIVDGKKITSSEIDILFNKCKPKGSRRMNYDGFLTMCQHLSQKKYPNKSPKVAYNLFLNHICDKGPIARATIVQANGVYGKLTDTKTYGATHKHRFDSDGKGRGAAGRVQQTGTISLDQVTNRMGSGKKRGFGSTEIVAKQKKADTKLSNGTLNKSNNSLSGSRTLRSYH